MIAFLIIMLLFPLGIGIGISWWLGQKVYGRRLQKVMLFFISSFITVFLVGSNFILESAELERHSNHGEELFFFSLAMLVLHTAVMTAWICFHYLKNNLLKSSLFKNNKQ